MLSGHWSARKIASALSLRPPAPVGQETQRARNYQRIIQPLLLHVRLPDNRQRRALLASRTILPSPPASAADGKRCSCLACRPWEKASAAWRPARDHAYPHERPPVRLMPLRPADKTRPPLPSRSCPSPPRRSCCADTARQPTDSAASPKSSSARISPFAPSRVARRMLHPGVRRHDEEARKPRSQETRNAANQCALGPSRFSPNKNNPRKLDSRKNENTPSIASVCPITPPADLEKRAQFVPN